MAPSPPVPPISPIPQAALDPGEILSAGPGGPGGRVKWWHLVATFGVVILVTASWSVWSLISTSRGPSPVPPVAAPSSTSSSPARPTTTSTPSGPASATSPTPPTTSATKPPTTTPVSSPSTTVRTPTTTSTSTTRTPSSSTTTSETTGTESPGPPLPLGTEVAAPARTLTPIGSRPARIRFEAYSGQGTATVTYGSNAKDDVRLRDQKLPYAAEVTVPDDTGYVYVMVYDYHYDDDAARPQMLCRLYVNDVLVMQQQGTDSAFCSTNVKRVFPNG